MEVDIVNISISKIRKHLSQVKSQLNMGLDANPSPLTTQTPQTTQGPMNLLV